MTPPRVAVLGGPPAERAVAVREALERGDSVMVRLPPATSAAVGAELAALAAARGASLTVVAPLRADPELASLAERVQDGALGRVRRAELSLPAPGSSDERTVDALDWLLWRLGPARAVAAGVDGWSLELVGGAVVEVRAGEPHLRVVGTADQLAQAMPAEREEATSVADTEAMLHLLEVLDAAAVAIGAGRRVLVAPAVRLRAAEAADRDRLLGWRNDPTTRRWSRRPELVTEDEHARWLTGVLADPSRRLWIAESDGEAVGQIRADEDVAAEPAGRRWVELHLAVAPEARGRGLAGALIRAAVARVLAERDVVGACAHVKDGNAASRRAFERSGFTVNGRDADGLLRLERRPVT